MRKSVIGVCAGLAIGSLAYTFAADPDIDESMLPRQYRVMPRLEIDKLGLDGKLPPNHSYDQSLERGLNILYAQGWELIAVEGEHSLAVVMPRSTFVQRTSSKR